MRIRSKDEGKDPSTVPGTWEALISGAVSLNSPYLGLQRRSPAPLWWPDPRGPRTGGGGTEGAVTGPQGWTPGNGSTEWRRGWASSLTLEPGGTVVLGEPGPSEKESGPDSIHKGTPLVDRVGYLHGVKTQRL